MTFFLSVPSRTDIHPCFCVKNPWWGDILSAIFSNMETRRNVMEEKSPLRLILR